MPYLTAVGNLRRKINKSSWQRNAGQGPRVYCTVSVESVNDRSITADQLYGSFQKQWEFAMLSRQSTPGSTRSLPLKGRLNKDLYINLWVIFSPSAKLVYRVFHIECDRNRCETEK